MAVVNARRKYAPHTVRPNKKHDWAAVDWSRRSADIARDFGISATQVWHMRKRKAPHTIMACSNKKRDWSGVDWSKSNVAIARDLDTSASVVSLARKRLGAPPSPLKFSRGRRARKIVNDET